MVSADIPPALQTRRPPLLRHVRFDDIPRERWEELYAVSPRITPFSSWTFHRAWWDAYGDTATEHYLIWSRPDVIEGIGPGGEGLASAIVPLMTQEHGPQGRVRGSPGGLGRPSVGELDRTTRALHFAASYHADYASVLCAAGDLADLAGDMAHHLADLLLREEVDVVDLRRLPEGDALSALLAETWQRVGHELGLAVSREIEDICPVVDLTGDWHTQLAGLGKKTRHEIRRKLRRAERTGPVELRYLPLDATSADRFIRLHQARWGSEGLFANGADGDRSRCFLRRLAELEAAAGASARFHLGVVSVGGRVVYALAGFSERGTCYFYNAGLDPAARDLSPGIIGTAAYLRDRIERGDRRFDFLRGDEAYKYEWGARDSRLTRLLVTRAGT